MNQSALENQNQQMLRIPKNILIVSNQLIFKSEATDEELSAYDHLSDHHSIFVSSDRKVLHAGDEAEAGQIQIVNLNSS